MGGIDREARRDTLLLRDVGVCWLEIWRKVTERDRKESTVRDGWMRVGLVLLEPTVDTLYYDCTCGKEGLDVASIAHLVLLSKC